MREVRYHGQYHGGGFDLRQDLRRTLDPMDPHLTELQDHYGSAYRLSHPEPDTWLALRRDDHETLKAQTPFELFDLIRQDYAQRPVPRRPR